jgi:UDP-N-acetylglucosamine 2-epimerase
MLAGTIPERILEAAKQMVSREKGWVNPFGDGRTAQKIISILRKKIAL